MWSEGVYGEKAGSVIPCHKNTLSVCIATHLSTPTRFIQPHPLTCDALIFSILVNILEVFECLYGEKVFLALLVDTL